MFPLYEKHGRGRPLEPRGLLLKAGIEMAVYDLIGKLKDMPVYQLLGGKKREKVPISRFGQHGDP